MGGRVYGGKDTDEATILPGGFSHSLQLRSSISSAASVTPRHDSFMIMQTGRRGGKRGNGAEENKKTSVSTSFIS